MRLDDRLRDQPLLGGLHPEARPPIPQGHDGAVGDGQLLPVREMLIVQGGAVPAPDVLHPPLTVVKDEPRMVPGDHVGTFAGDRPLAFRVAPESDFRGLELAQRPGLDLTKREVGHGGGKYDTLKRRM